LKHLLFRKIAYIMALIAIHLGVTIYALWRADIIRFFSWVDAIGLYAPVEIIRSRIYPLHIYIPEWIIYSLPNGLWAFSYALIMTHLWRDNHSKIKYFWFGSIPLLTIGYELLQYTGMLTGVFCYQDLFFSTAGIGMGIILGLTFYKENKK
jgi:hypothetical protein